MTSNRISFFKLFDGTSLLMDIDVMCCQHQETTKDGKNRLKMFSMDKGKVSQCMKKHIEKESLNKLLHKQIETAKILKVLLDKHASITMANFLAKLGHIENLSNEMVLVILDAIKDNLDNKVTLMTWKWAILHAYIEHIVALHLYFHDCTM